MSCKILTPSFKAAQAKRSKASMAPTPIMSDETTRIQVGMPVVDFGLGVVGFPEDKGVWGKDVVTGGRVGDWVPNPVPLAISGHKGTTEAPPFPYKYASHCTQDYSICSLKLYT
jgi:hypothetical protein